MDEDDLLDFDNNHLHDFGRSFSPLFSPNSPGLNSPGLNSPGLDFNLGRNVQPSPGLNSPGLEELDTWMGNDLLGDTIPDPSFLNLKDSPQPQFQQKNEVVNAYNKKPPICKDIKKESTKMDVEEPQKFESFQSPHKKTGKRKIKIVYQNKNPIKKKKRKKKTIGGIPKFQRSKSCFVILKPPNQRIQKQKNLARSRNNHMNQSFFMPNHAFQHHQNQMGNPFFNAKKPQNFRSNSNFSQPSQNQSCGCAIKGCNGKASMWTVNDIKNAYYELKDKNSSNINICQQCFIDGCQGLNLGRKNNEFEEFEDFEGLDF